MVTEFRPPTSLKFDTEKEKDLIEKIKGLKQGKDLTTLCEYLLRIFLESPETLRNIGETKDVMEKIAELGMTPARYNFFSQVAKEVNDMKDKVDALYTMMYKTHILALAGHRLGLEKKSEDSLRAVFLLEKQVADLSKVLGVDTLGHTFVSNKIQNTRQMADEVLECIIESYDSILTELKDSIQITGSINLPINGLVDSTIMQNNNDSQVNGDNGKQKQETTEQTDGEDEYINLIEKPESKNKSDELIVAIPDADAASLLDSWMS